MLHAIFRKNIYIIALVSALFLGACSKQNQLEKDLEAYADRLESFTGIVVDDVDNRYSLNLAPKTSLKQDVPDFTINLREFYAFNECSLNQLVAQRNTALGKMQLPSARFAYETQLIAQMRACADFLRSADGKNEELVNKLESWTITKQASLPLVWANLITQSNETYGMLSKSSGFIQGNASDDFQGTKQALRYLISSKTEHPVDLSALEGHLQQLDNSNLLSKKWRSQLLVKRQLDAMSALLTQYLQTNTCNTPAQEKDLNIMRNIFTLFFAEKIQPVGGELNRYHYQLSPIIAELLAIHDWPESFSSFVKTHHFVEHEEYKASMQKHIELWQSLFRRCG